VGRARRRDQGFADGSDKVGKVRPPNFNTPDYDKLSPGRTEEPITVYTRNGVLNRRVGEFDLTPEPTTRDIGEVWLLANETLVPDASRFYRSRPDNFRNPLMTPDGVPSVAFRWMDVEGPLYDERTTAGYRLLFGELPLAKLKPGAPGLAVPAIAQGDRREGGRNAGQRIEPLEETRIDITSAAPRTDAERLLRGLLTRAYRRPVAESDVQRFLALFDERRTAGLSFAEAMVATYTAVLASPGFVFLTRNPARSTTTPRPPASRSSSPILRPTPLSAPAPPAANRASPPCSAPRPNASSPTPNRPDSAKRFWITGSTSAKSRTPRPPRRSTTTTTSTTSLTEAAVAETRLTFEEMLRADLSARTIVDADFTYLNERLADPPTACPV